MTLPAIRPDPKRQLLAEAIDFAGASKADGTLYVYERAWLDFEHFCEVHHGDSLPASVPAVVAYLTIRQINRSIAALIQRGVVILC